MAVWLYRPKGQGPEGVARLVWRCMPGRLEGGELTGPEHDIRSPVSLRQSSSCLEAA